MKALLPVASLLALGVMAGLFFIMWTIAHPAQHAYLVTPETFPAFSARGLKVTEENWSNTDGTRARGWLLRGAAGSPSIVLLHNYGADRSWLFNLGVKINEATNYTILWPDLRGHGENPPVSHTSFGTREATDLTAAASFLQSLKTAQQRPLVSDRFGFYGVGLGAYAALAAAARSPEGASVQALVLDSVPASPDEILHSALHDRFGFNSGFLNFLTRGAARIYFLGSYRNEPSCRLASQLAGKRILLLSGEDAGDLRAATKSLVQCFPAPAAVTLKADLPITGFTASSATGEQGEAYDRLVIEFFSGAFNEDAPPPR